MDQSDIADAARRQAVVLDCLEKQGSFDPLTEGERNTCKALRLCGLIKWDAGRKVFVPGPEWDN